MNIWAGDPCSIFDLNVELISKTVQSFCEFHKTLAKVLVNKIVAIFGKTLTSVSHQ